MHKKHVLGSSQYFEKADRKTNALASETLYIGCTIACHETGEVPNRADPRRSSIGDPDLGISEVVRPLFAAVSLARGPGARDHIGADRPSLRLVAIEQRFRRRALPHQRKLPGKVIGIL